MFTSDYRISAFIATLLVSLIAAPPVQAAKTSVTGMANYTLYPLFQNPTVPPISLIALSIDHQLFNKAYTDYTDLTGDGVPETTYVNAVNYSGYFDSDLCYTYAAGQYKASARRDAVKKCDGSTWSGNFLNWVTMTRLDILRWSLYGGNRSTDTAAATVLERTHIPQDGHAYTKIYLGTAGVPVNAVTPFTFGSVSFCNTTSTADPSATTVSPPVIQMASGSWPTWTLVERYQCDYGRGAETPPTPGGGAAAQTYTVRVQVCDGAFRESFCRPYTDAANVTTYKPAGLLQEYGENAGSVQFGLISGSYDRPRSGGVLRSAIGQVGSPGTGAGTGEVDTLTGIFKNQGNGTPGIINTIARIRMSQYTRDTWQDCNSPGIDNNQLSNTNGSRKCSMWGNPISEIYAEALRYFSGENPAGRTPTAAFDADDAAIHITGMPKTTGAWPDPLANRPACTGCSIIVISTGLNSFDRDEVPAVANVATAAERVTAMDAIGANEVIGTSILTGEVLTAATDTTAAAGAGQRSCSAKVGTMSQLSGICPEVASLQGGYDIAGLAYRAHTNDVRPALGVAGTDFANQKIDTYTLSLAESLPRLDFAVGTGSISVLPFAQSTSAPPGWKSSSIVNFTPGFLVGAKVGADVGFCNSTPTIARCNWYGYRDGNDATHGSYVINWEDSTWGNDYDQDGVHILSYCVGAACNRDLDALNGPDICENNFLAPAAPQPACAGAFAPGQLYLRSEVVNTAAGFAIRFGWITAGSNAPGVNVPFVKDSGVNRNCLAGANCYAAGWTRPQIVAYTPSNTGAKLLENPLFYAAKYGGFVDTLNPPVPPATVGVGDGIPNNVGTVTVNGVTVPTGPEWDKTDLEGANNPDGIPDNYFPVRNPNLLKEQLARIFQKVAATVGSGTSAAVVSSSGEGPGAVFQAVYAEEQTSQADALNKVRWTGTIRGLWVTPTGKFAEDVNQNGLYDPVTDTEVAFVYDTTLRRTVISRGGTNAELSTLRPIWDAATKLAAVPAAGLDTNRAYATAASNGRYIFTWIDANKDGKLNAGEQVPFDFSAAGSGFTPSRFWPLNSDSAAEAQRLVNWVRGIDQPAVVAAAGPPVVQAAAALRSRKLDINGDGTAETLRLGDIVNSSPLVVSTPNQNIDLLYEDNTYTSFILQYRERRNVVYVGANDGMLHAFNGGFNRVSGAAQGFFTTSAVNPSATAHPLGSELWAYVPKNLQAHLRWMTGDDYTHVFYVDGSPQSYDVKAFAADADHPFGWGTILVVPFRLGGGAISVDSNADATPDLLSAPGYLVMDVTNPEQPPKVLTEIILPNNATAAGLAGSGNSKTSYSYSKPALVFNQTVASNISSYTYKLVLGSGPTVLKPEVYSDQKASVYVYNLTDIIAGGGALPGPQSFLIDRANSFTGDMVSADFDVGGTTDAVYFGTVEGLPNAPAPRVNNNMTGALMKMPIEDVSSILGINGQPRPARTFNVRSPAVFFPASGTIAPVQGRPSIARSARSLPSILFGTGRMLSRGDFVSGTQNSLYILDDISPYTNRAFAGTLPGPVAFPLPAPPITAIADYRTRNGERGLQVNLRPGVGVGGTERSVTSPAIFRGIGVFGQFIPDGEVCRALGTSQLTLINFAGDATDPDATTIGLNGGGPTNGGVSDPRIYVPAQQPTPPCGTPPCATPTPPQAVIITQDSTGALNTARAINVSSDGLGEQSWFQTREN
jgi:type IV pilus assembly protein PilY1